jgi:hypothetical protein
MFIEHEFKKTLLAPEERNVGNPAFHWQNIALLWSAGFGIIRVSINIRLLRSQRVVLICGISPVLKSPPTSVSLPVFSGSDRGLSAEISG